ncbi:MAG: hypothetical protein CL840_06430 [Crocinitomicaceae bacterium]|nr:hypothetical protein [Crocinitomicaceae bacterium]|tara:strand:- start:578 stop:1462 length:885 start_codon:yes stop_codon:yes gene_type:complete
MCIKRSIPFLFLVLSYFTFSCKKDTTSGVPAYVKIDEVSVVTDLKKEGSASSNIADVWFFANGDELGVFELPCEIPVLEEGNTNLSLFGGIKQSGVSSLRAAYPFYETYRMDTTLVQEKTITIKPVLKYKDGITFPWKEGFDDLSFTVDTTAESQVAITRVTHPDSVKEGKASMGVYMTTERPYFLAASSETFALPNLGEDVYLEFDYQTNRRIQILVRAYNTTGNSLLIPIVLVRSKEDENGTPVWSKMYAFLSPYLPAFENAYKYQFYFESGIDVTKESDGYFLMDNIKVVY